MATDKPSSPTPEPLELDLSGLMCPFVVLRLGEALANVETGRVVRLVSTDPLSAIDVPVFLKRNGHRLLTAGSEPSRHVFLLEAGHRQPG